jgi:hypothetical protein
MRAKWGERPDYLHDTILKAFTGRETSPVYKEAPTAVPPAAPTAAEDHYNEFYYSSGSRDFILYNPINHTWIPLSENSFKGELSTRGFAATKKKGENASMAQIEISRIRKEGIVEYAGELCGYKPGVYTINGSKVLVTKGPKIVEPIPGDYTLLDRFFRSLLCDDTAQIDHFYGWLKIAYESLRSGDIRQGQCVAFVGKPGTGKTFAQSLITDILGGRSAHPYKYMAGETTFNGDLFKAEHQIIDDECAQTDIQARRAFGQGLKKVVATEKHQMNAKYQGQIDLIPFWRITLSLNDNPESLMILPPIDEDIEGKLTIFQTRQASVFPADSSRASREAFRLAIFGQIPAFLDMLVKWEMPEYVMDNRFGVRAYINPEIGEELRSSQPEERLHTYINLYMADNGLTEWTGSADDLQNTLSTSRYAPSTNTLLGRWDRACGTYLSRLQARYPLQFERLPRRGDDIKRWKIVIATPR